MPPKKGKKEKNQLSSPNDTPDSQLPSFIVKQTLDMCIVIEKYKMEIKALRADNKHMMEEIAFLRQESNWFEAVSKKRQEKVYIVIREVKEKEKDQLAEVEEKCSATLAELERERTNMLSSLENNKTDKLILLKKLSDMDSYKYIEEAQVELVDALQVELEATKAKTDQQAQDLKRAYAKEHNAVDQILQLDLCKFEPECFKTASSSMVKFLKVVGQNNSRLVGYLKETLKKRREMATRKERLDQCMASLERQEQYYTDIMCIHDNTSFKKATHPELTDSSDQKVTEMAVVPQKKYRVKFEDKKSEDTFPSSSYSTLLLSSSSEEFGDKKRGKSDAPSG